MKILHREFLPTKTLSVHASTICFWKGHMVSAWFGGSREGQPDTAIYLHNLNNDKKTISIGTKDMVPRWNPILVPIGKKLYLFTKSGIFCDRWQTFIHDITDWANDITEKEIYHTAKVLPAGLNGPVKSKPLIDFDGVNRIMRCGSSVETIYDWSSYIESFTINPDDTFQFAFRSIPLSIENKITYSNPINGVTERSLGIIQPTIWKDIKMRAFFRSSRGLGKIYYSSCVGGEWQVPIPTNLPNPNSAVDVVYTNNRLFLVHNPDKVYRSPLVISEIKMIGVEYNNVAEFKIVDSIEITKEVDGNIRVISPELSYPYLIEHDGNLHLSYTYGRSLIEHCIISV